MTPYPIHKFLREHLDGVLDGLVNHFDLLADHFAESIKDQPLFINKVDLYGRSFLCVVSETIAEDFLGRKIFSIVAFADKLCLYPVENLYGRQAFTIESSTSSEGW